MCREGTLWYYRSARSSIEGLVPAVLAAELQRAIEELERLARGNSG